MVMHKMMQEKKATGLDYPSSAAVGIIGGGISGVIGGAFYDFHHFIGAFAGLLVALFLTYSVRKH